MKTESQLNEEIFDKIMSEKNVTMLNIECFDLQICMNKARQQGIEIGKTIICKRFADSIVTSPEMFLEKINSFEIAEKRAYQQGRDEVIKEIEEHSFLRVTPKIHDIYYQIPKRILDQLRN